MLSTRVFPTRVWVHVAVVHSDGVAQLYLNGVLGGSSAVPQAVRKIRTYALLGDRTDFSARGAQPGWFDGMIDDVRLWDAARSDVDIRANRMAALPDAGDSQMSLLLLAYSFDADEDVGTLSRALDATVSDVVDISGSSRGGELICRHSIACRVSVPGARVSCGDGSRNSDSEACDDGNVRNGDGCSAECQIESGWSCAQGQPGATHTCVPGYDLWATSFEADEDVQPAAWNPTLAKQHQVDGSTGTQTGDWSSGVRQRYHGERGLRIRAEPMFQFGEASMPDDLSVWLRADAGVSTSGVGAVSSWADSSGNGGDATVPSGASAPTITAEDESLGGLPSIQFSGTNGLVAPNMPSVDAPYTVFAVSRLDANTGGFCVGSMDYNIRVGVTDQSVGWHTPQSGWVASPGGRSYSLARMQQWYITVGVAEPGRASFFRDSALVAVEEVSMGPFGRVAIHRGANNHAQSKCSVAEVLVFARALEEHERQVVEQYLASKYGLHGPHTSVCDRLYSASPAEYFTFGSRVLRPAVGGPAGAVIAPSTQLRFAARLEHAPHRFGVPLSVLVVDAGDGSVGTPPVPSDCDGSVDGGLTCGGRRFYSVCVNGGNAYVHCDDTISTAGQTWFQNVIELGASWAGKYGESVALPSALRVYFGVLACDTAAEAWIDDVVLTTPVGEAECARISASSLGLSAYQTHVMASRPEVYYRLGEATGPVVDSAAALFSERSGGVDGQVGAGVGRSVAGLVSDPDDDTAMRFSTSDSGSVVSFDAGVQKVDSSEGFTLEFWIRLESEVTGGDRAPIFSDSDGGDTTAGCITVTLDTSARLEARISTTWGDSAIVVNEPLVLHEVHHVAVQWNPLSGQMRIWLDGRFVSFSELPFVDKPLPNVGIPVRTGRAFRLGWDGGTSHAASATFVLDEVALYRRELLPAELWRHFGLSLNADGPSAVASVTFGNQDAISLDGVDDNGAVFAVLDPDDLSLLSGPHKFDFAQSSLASAQDAVDALAEFLDSDADIASGGFVAGAVKMEKPTRRVLYEYGMYAPHHNRNIEARHSDNGYRWFSNDDYKDAYANTWSGAKQYCEDRDRVLCRVWDYCNIGTWPTTQRLYTVFGEVEGLGYAPYDSRTTKTNEWLSVGKAFDERVCRNWTSIFPSETGPSWGDSSGIDNAPFLCCSRAPPQPHWENVVQRWWDYVSNSTTELGVYYYDNPYFTNQHSWFRSASYFVGVLGHNRNYDGNSECNHILLGAGALLTLPAATEWTDYSVEVRMYSHYRHVGILFRYTDNHNFYGWYAGADYRCQSFVKYKNGVGSTHYIHRSGGPIVRWRWYDVRIDVESNTMRAFVDGSLVGSWTDDSGDPLTKGSIALWASYNAHTAWDNLRVYSRGPLDTTAADAALQRVALPPLPLSYSKTAFSETPAAGASWAAIGRREVDVGSAPWDESLLATYDAKLWQRGGMPAASARSGDGMVRVSTLFNCHDQGVVLVPENSLNGTFLQRPLRFDRAANPTGARIANGDLERIFSLAPYSGQFAVADDQLRDESTALNYEATQSYTITTTVTARGFDSGWFAMRSQSSDSAPYRTVSFDSHSDLSGLDVGAVSVRVLLRAADGPNAGFTFSGSLGASVWSDNSAWWASYGGIISGVSRGRVHLWAPSFAQYGRGYIINLGAGHGGEYDSQNRWVGERNVQKSHSAMVRVLVDALPAPDYDSDWTYLGAQRQSDSYQQQFVHGIRNDAGGYDWPAECRVLVRGVDGPTAGITFEARGDGMRTGHYSNGGYGGVMFAWEKRWVKVVAPSWGNGYTVHIGAGWGGTQASTPRHSSVHSDVRVQCWRKTIAPDFESEWDETPLYKAEQAYREIDMYRDGHGLRSRPAKVQVLVKDPRNDWIYPAVAMEQTHNHVYHTGGGVVFAYNDTAVRVWAPSYDPMRGSNNLNTPLRTRHGWGGDLWVTESYFVHVKVRAWAAFPGIRDSSTVKVQVVDVQEPPVAEDFAVELDEVVDGVRPLGAVARFEAEDEDDGAIISYALQSGNVGGAFTS